MSNFAAEGYSKHKRDNTDNQNIAEKVPFSDLSATVENPYPAIDMNQLFSRLVSALTPHGFVQGSDGALSQSSQLGDNSAHLVFWMEGSSLMIEREATVGDVGIQYSSVTISPEVGIEELRLKTLSHMKTEFVRGMPLRIIVELADEYDLAHDPSVVRLVVADDVKEHRHPGTLPYSLISYSDAEKLLAGGFGEPGPVIGQDLVVLDVYPEMVKA